MSGGLLCLLFSNTGVAAPDKTKQNLDDLKQQIVAEKQSLTKDNKQQQQLQSQLKKDDLAIASNAQKINAISKDKAEVEKQLDKLGKQQADLNRKRQQQEQVLAEQIRSAYYAGHHDYLKLLLNQQDPNEVSRNLTYYQYLNEARVASIDDYKSVIKDLLDVEREQRQQADKLSQLIDEQQQQKQALESNRKQRQATLKQINSKILSSKQRLTKLEEEEKSLIQALARLQAMQQEAWELNGLGKFKNKLQWPVQGRITHAFGQRKQGYLRWKGVLMSAPVGKPVYTIHNGTVLFADWLKGYGLVVVIDHGKGYMSLYGHNQTLLKKVGDRVEIGEPIALVGQSGGQNKAGVYFEIRHKGKPVNPKHWCK
ncbi:murein hydrolase activator EnvC family protein [Thalassotalea sp. PS06]|uniref:murein hydrolase activator EnvC family protein n=1 Tax=Thalassotalea sp. PS06 TaxID=2594005 RepID=UPI00116251D9|nr:peptidoglycan DD-metalloendopeptidase family protein [Thalassotalea sp. PS06]QDO99990.1 peptidoglycan DD-metalloendopeptidase family protein [Thalassotalea sp. PS06]